MSDIAMDDSRLSLGDVFREVAFKTGISSPVIIEKDYWLVKVLQILFSDASFSKEHAFKGGTSLSKCFSLIQRFSEDLDITISRKALGFKENREEIASFSGSKAKRYFKSLVDAAILHVQGLADLLTENLSQKLHRTDWKVYVDSQDPQKIVFEYPRTLSSSTYPEKAYMAPKILLEFGSRGDTVPSMPIEIASYVETVYTELFPHSEVKVNTLMPEKTFWEKITLLHMLAHQSDEKPFGYRMARHYYDVYMFTHSDIFSSALENIHLLDDTVEHKSIYFKSRQASYETARLGSLRLMPKENFSGQVRQDYTAMAEMFYGEALPFNVVMEGISQLEEQINSMQLVDLA